MEMLEKIAVLFNSKYRTFFRLGTVKNFAKWSVCEQSVLGCTAQLDDLLIVLEQCAQK